MLRSFTITEGIIKGHTYRFMYRVKNQIGWTDWSTVTYILAASVPDKPPAAKIITSSDSSLYLRVFEPTDNGGSIVTKYSLYMDSGSGFTAIQS